MAAVIAGRRAGLALYTFLLIGCEDRQPEPQLRSVEPDTAYTDREVRLQIHGESFVPSFLVDPSSGRREAKANGFSARLIGNGMSVALSEVTWVSVDRLSAVLARGQAQLLPIGAYDVEITDPRGQTTQLGKPAFTALGVDPGIFTVTIDAPAVGTYVAPGSRLSVSAVARRSAPGAVKKMDWLYQGPGGEIAQGQCAPGNVPQEVRCSFEFTVGEIAPGAEVVFTFAATDWAMATASAEQRLPVQRPPRVQRITPSRGGTAGGTDVVISGSGFTPDAQLLVDGLPLTGGGVRIDANMITGHMPPHAAGTATLVVRTGPGVVSPGIQFDYFAPPTLERLSTDWGLVDQDTSVEIWGSNFTTQTHVLLGPSLSTAVRVKSDTVSDTVIRALFPAGSAGRTTIWALDADLGWTRLIDGFTWRPTPP
jgi:hypothetical protein